MLFKLSNDSWLNLPSSQNERVRMTSTLTSWSIFSWIGSSSSRLSSLNLIVLKSFGVL